MNDSQTPFTKERRETIETLERTYHQYFVPSQEAELSESLAQPYLARYVRSITTDNTLALPGDGSHWQD